MARRRAARTIPDWMAYNKAMTARRSRSILHVIVPFIEVNPATGAERIAVRDGSSFVIKVNHQTQESLLLTCAHVVPPTYIHDTLCVRNGADQFLAHILHINRMMDVAVLRVAGLTAAPPLRFSEDDPAIADGITVVGYCDAKGLFGGFSAIPGIYPGRISGTEEQAYFKRIRLYHLLVSSVAMHGMSGGPIMSRTGIVGMTAGREYGRNYGVHRRTIFALLKRFAGVPQQAALTMADVIDML